MSARRSMESDYQKASKLHKDHPDLIQSDAVLGMGYLLGAGMPGAASALTALYVRAYGWDALPDMIKEMEEGVD